MLNNKTAWVLTDGRFGNDNQSKALANILGLNYEIKHLKYNMLAFLPNRFGLGLSILKETNLPHPLPDVVISAGRRCAAIAVALKKQKPELKLIQIMQPEMSFKHFDVLIFPKHDPIPSKKYLLKTILIDGAISFYPLSRQAENKAYWQKQFVGLSSPYIGVSVGGASKGCTFTEQHADELMNTLLELAKSKGASLLINTSRRTPPQVLAIIKKRLAGFAGKYFLNDINKQSENPFLGILAIADYIVTTGDSISMCSEAAEMGKPLYIFFAKGQISKKHEAFVTGLIAEGRAKKFTPPVEDFSPPSKSYQNELREKIMALL